MHKEIIEQITKIVEQYGLDDGEPLFFGKYGFTGDPDDGFPVTSEMVPILVHTMVQNLETPIYLYVCKDNAAIQVENHTLKDEEPSDLLACYDHEITPGLLVGWD
jgi:hypothetical protein